MSSASKSPRDYSRKYQRVILEPWRQSHGLPPSPPSPPPNRTTPASPISNNSLSSSLPLQNSTQNLNGIHHLSNLLNINFQQEIKDTNPSPPTLPYIPLPSLDQDKKNNLVKYMILSGADNYPPMLEKDLYDSWKSRMELYMKNREHGRMILESVENGPLIWPTVEEN
ncbi:hypothetical protein Tco_0155298 [Tanacetum coccineum]